MRSLSVVVPECLKAMYSPTTGSKHSSALWRRLIHFFDACRLSGTLLGTFVCVLLNDLCMQSFEWFHQSILMSLLHKRLGIHVMNMDLIRIQTMSAASIKFHFWNANPYTNSFHECNPKYRFILWMHHPTWIHVISESQSLWPTSHKYKDQGCKAED